LRTVQGNDVLKSDSVLESDLSPYVFRTRTWTRMQRTWTWSYEPSGLNSYSSP